MYFAIQAAKNAPDKKKAAAVWVLDTGKLRAKVSLATGVPKEEHPFDTIQKHHHTFATKSLWPQVRNEGLPNPITVLVEPFRKNERLTIQQGFFLFPCDLRTDFQSNLAVTFDLSPGRFVPPKALSKKSCTIHRHYSGKSKARFTEELLGCQDYHFGRL